MRPLVAVLLLCHVAFTLPASGQQSFPYTTYVLSDEVHIRSGPGQDYYPTDKLKRGQAVEVYRHDPGGWCAIRPVDGSFAWVASRYLRPTQDGLATVTQEGVAARVGSRMSDVRDVVQVRLQKGETVELLDSPPSGPGLGENKWCRIAPPSGEFRWVSAKYLSTEYSNEGLRKAPLEKPSQHTAAEAPSQASPDSSAPRIPAAALAGGELSEPSSDTLRASAAVTRSLTPEEYQAELQRVELELSVMVIEEPAAWSFESLGQRTNFLLDQAQTAVERGRARLLANKIARFDDIKQRQDAVLAMREQTDRNGRLWAGLRSKDGDDKSVAKVQIDGRFDGVGLLTQVVSPKVGAPRYVLMDEAGDVRCYVTPAPGVNLHHLVGRQVGVTGTRGYMPEQHSSHIMARHVAPLEGTTLR